MGAGTAGLQPERDAAQVARTLRRVGPLPLADLGHEPDLVGWSARRIENAVVSAWSRNLIFIDPRDQLVAI